MNLSFNELRELVAALNQTDIAELKLKNADFELTLRKPSAVQPEVVMSSAPAAPAMSTTPASSAPSAPAPSEPADEPDKPATPATDPSLVEITAPMVGTFYRAPAPEEAMFVEVGDRIQTGQTVCIIEAMKLMNELEAEVSGEIVDILVENAEPVEFGQALMRVRPAR